MASQLEVRVPDIGDFTDIPVIEVLVGPGDSVAPEDALVTLESDKATMDVPSPHAGTVESVAVAVGDTVSEGTLVLTLTVEDGGEAAGDDAGAAPAEAGRGGAAREAATGEQASPADRGRGGGGEAGAASGGEVVEVKVPDIGDFTNIPVIEVLVKPGDTVSVEDALLTLESDKATMDVPSPAAGTVEAVLVSVGDEVSEGTAIVRMKAGGASRTGADSGKPAAKAEREPESRREVTARSEPAREATPAADASGAASASGEARAAPGRPSPTAALAGDEPGRGANPSHATPGVRRFARELGVDIARVTGTGRKGRILEDDVKRFVKAAVAGQAAVTTGTAGAGIPAMPEVDFSKWGPVEVEPLSRIKRVSGPHLHRAWLNVPHVTNHDEVDVTELEAFRRSLKTEAEKAGVRVTPLVFIMKALVRCLREFPSFNASLSTDAQSLVLKRYFNLGIAVDTPNGLVVPVVRDVDAKGVFDLSRELAETSERARDGKLKLDEMQGGCMSISSLGGIGGVGFTPIVNAPEVAILGVSRSRMAPVWDGEAFAPRMMLPLDLSYDHRVIDGAQAARFLARLGQLLGDVRRLLL